MMVRGRSQRNWEMPVEKSLAAYLVAFYLQTLLYGIYVVLFGMASYSLYKKRATTHWLLSLAGIVMFALATGDIGLTHHYLFRDLLKGNDPVLRLKHIYVKVFLYVTSNATAGALLIYRSYTLWGHQKRIIFLPVVLLVALTALGYAFLSVVPCPLREYAKIYLWLTFAINIFVTFLTASRIWSIALERRRLLGTKHANKCHNATAIVIESGIIYSTYVLISVLVKSTLFFNSLVQVAGIVPAAIIVQVGLGRDTRSVEKTLDNATTPIVQQRVETTTSEESITVDGRT